MESTRQQQYRDEPLMERLQSEPELIRAINEINLRELRKLETLFQMEMHSTMLAVSMADTETISNTLAMCKGSSMLISWLEELKRQLVEYEESGAYGDGYDS